jgi:hypothetical protein
MQQQYDEAMVKSLAATVRDESKPVEERYAALRHICQLKGDTYQHVPEEHLRFVAGALVQWIPGVKPLSLKDAAEAVAEGFRRRTAPIKHA